ncbi:flavin-containing monooxygenase [Plantactinospora sp. GCM10030261]|uniref:flavin-containing monooxygenase n=1 Tax=Plantactinospora sp. GCM10030261 TaxID=3273420 RepID=UPI00360B27DD
MPNSQTSVVVIGGGQSGLAAARAVRDAGLHPLVLEAGDRPVGSWPHYYDSLTLFSPARYSAMPGLPFPGDPDRYPTRDEVADYLRSYADSLGVEIRTGHRVRTVSTTPTGFLVHTAAGEEIPASGIVAASGTFGRPHLPVLPGQQEFSGEVRHVAQYREPAPYAGRRVIVVGAGNSAVQVGYELADVATVTLASVSPVHFLDQRPNGRDLHHWLDTSGFDDLPPAWLAKVIHHIPVLDTGGYRKAFESGVIDRRPMFTTFEEDRVVWADGTSEHVDAVIFATGYRPHLDYLEPIGALDAGLPQHVAGISTTHPGLVYVGLEFQRSFSSNTLRGVSRDADYVVSALAAHVRDAVTIVGL